MKLLFNETILPISSSMCHTSIVLLVPAPHELGITITNEIINAAREETCSQPDRWAALSCGFRSKNSERELLANILICLFRCYPK